MKEKILAELRKKYPGLHASVLGLLAEKLEPTVTEDNQIEAAVTALETQPIKPADYAALLQKEGDRRVTEALKKKVDPPAPKKEEDHTPPDDSAVGKQLQAVMAKLEALEKKENHKAVSEKFYAKLKEKKIPLQFAAGVSYESADDLEAAIQSAEKNFLDVKQEMINQGLVSGLGKPAGGGEGVPGDKAATVLDAEIKAWAEKGKAPVKA